MHLILFAANNSVNNFTGLFTSSIATSSVGNSVVSSSTSLPQLGNIFGIPQTTTINTSTNVTKTSGQPFIFNTFQSAQTTAASTTANPTQFGGQMAQPNLNFSNTSSLFNQPQTQTSKNSGFNFMAHVTNTTPNFSFNMQPSTGSGNATLFAAPPGGFNLPSTAAVAQPRRKTKTPTRSKPKRK